MNSQPASAHTAGRLTVCESSHGKELRALRLDNQRVLATVWAVAAESEAETEANAARLALAWNSHDELTDGLRSIIAELSKNEVETGSFVGLYPQEVNSLRIARALLAKLTA